MGRTTRSIDIVDAALREAVDLGLCHLQAEDEPLDGRSFRVAGRETLNFASCSYLGLELDPRLRDGAIEAVTRYGTQFSSSRGYVSAPPYEELESLLDRIFGAHVLVLPSTTLSHLAALPVIVGDEDAVILDQQVHQSVRMAVPQLRVQGSPVDIVRHGRVDLLEERIRELCRTHDRVWYLADGVYSMYGDFAPVKALSFLLERYEQLHLYVDDAHGMSWTGRHGHGFATDSFKGHERVVVAVSLNKAFAAAGGSLVFSDRALRQRVKNCGGPFIFSGPIQPPMLGAALASARIHLSPDIEPLQAELLERIRFANRTARELDLPLVSTSEVPIRFVGVSKKRAAFDLAQHLLSEGFYTNASAFPVVGPRNAGLRFTVTRHLSLDDIRRMLEILAARLPESLRLADIDREAVDRVFDLEPKPSRRPTRPAGSPLVCRRESSIRSLDAAEWNRCLGAAGAFDASTLSALEDVFGPHQPPENRWRFHYFVVRDGAGRPVAATFFTQALWKDDLLAAARVSKAVEDRRKTDPYFLTSETLAMGSLLTEGNHLHLDRGGDWHGALSLLLAAVEEERREGDASAVAIRDLDPADEELGAALEAEGFVRVALPDSMEIAVDWRDREEFLAARSKRERRFHREKVEPFDAAWELEVLRVGSRELAAEEWAHLHGLYRNVQGRQLALNTFPLPDDLLPRLASCPGWELLLMRLRPEHGGTPGGPVRGFMACHAGPERYSPVFIGMDYEVVETHGLYRQLLSRTVWRAHELRLPRVAFGMGSELEKARFGATPVERVLYVQVHDRYHHDVLEMIASDPTLQGED